jgi:hypothetical protein
LHGSPAWLPYTGTVSVLLVLVPCPGSALRPKKYWVPSVVVIFQYSPLSSPLSAPVSRSTREPSSPRKCQPLPVSCSSSPPRPLRLIVALSDRQHWSLVCLPALFAPSVASSQHGR